MLIEPVTQAQVLEVTLRVRSAAKLRVLLSHEMHRQKHLAKRRKSQIVDLPCSVSAAGRLDTLGCLERVWPRAHATDILTGAWACMSFSSYSAVVRLFAKI